MPRHRFCSKFWLGEADLDCTKCVLFHDAFNFLEHLGTVQSWLFMVIITLWQFMQSGHFTSNNFEAKINTSNSVAYFTQQEHPKVFDV